LLNVLFEIMGYIFDGLVDCLGIVMRLGNKRVDFLGALHSLLDNFRNNFVLVF
jgi:hypothetical protein